MAAAAADLPVAVHAESEEITAGLTRRLIANGRNDIAAFLESRPVVAEMEAITERGVWRGRRDAVCTWFISVRGAVLLAALEARAAGHRYLALRPARTICFSRKRICIESARWRNALLRCVRRVNAIRCSMRVNARGGGYYRFGPFAVSA